MEKTLFSKENGTSFVEILISTLLLLLAIIVVFNVFTVTTLNTTVDRCRINALNEARKKIESLKSLDYDAIGVGLSNATPPYLGYIETDYTLPGYTEGVDIPLVETFELDKGIQATRYVLVAPVDDTFDKTGIEDTDDDTWDYKRITVLVRWTERNQPLELSLTTYLEGTSELDIGGGDEDKMVKKKKEKKGKGGMGMGGKSKIDPADSLIEPVSP